MFSQKTELWDILQGDRALSQCDSFILEDGLERLFIGDTGETSADALFRFPKKWSF